MEADDAGETRSWHAPVRNSRQATIGCRAIRICDHEKAILAAARPYRDGEVMKRIRIVHRTEYFYNQPVTFGPASPLSGAWEGPADAVDRIEVSVQVVAL
jgi:hypothetical protein